MTNKENIHSFFLGKPKAVLIESDDDDSPLPSWLVEHDADNELLIHDSDSDVKEVLSPLDLISPSSQDDKKDVKPVEKPEKTTEKPKVEKASKHKQSSDVIPVMVSEKMSQNKVLVELSHRDGLQTATDLSGDSGAIGRITIGSLGDSEQILVDLKGVLYSANIVPTPGSIAVLNMGPSEARIETMFDDFVQLREDPRFTVQHAGIELSDTSDEDAHDDRDDKSAKTAIDTTKTKGKRSTIAKGPAIRKTAKGKKKAIKRK